MLQVIIRRLDLDADARLSLREFKDGLRPIEKSSPSASKQPYIEKYQRPRTAYVDKMFSKGSRQRGDSLDRYDDDREYKMFNEERRP